MDQHSQIIASDTKLFAHFILVALLKQHRLKKHTISVSQFLQNLVHDPLRILCLKEAERTWIMIH